MHSAKSIIKIIIFLIFGLSSLFAQVINYTEVNVYGWGQGLYRPAPALMDIDNDGYMDMLIGTSNGRLWHFEQSTGDEFSLKSRNFSDIDVGSEATPTFTDINHNGLIDLLVGDNSELTWFEQDEINSETFIFISDDLISVDPGAHWTPAAADLNNDGLLELIIGESLGTLWYFEQDSLNAGTFTLTDDNWLGWDGGVYVHPFFTDFDNDSLLDLFVGAATGSIYHLVQDDTNATTFHQVSEIFAGIDFNEFVVPWLIDFDQDDKMDLFIGSVNKGMFHYEQVDSTSEEFTLISDDILDVRDFGTRIGYTVCDIDGDNLLDMLVSAYDDYYNSYVVHLEQETIGSLNFKMINEQFNDISIGIFSNLALYDINGNGLLDLFVGSSNSVITHYEQQEINSYNFSLVNDNFNNGMKVGQTQHPTFCDIDGDSLLDMIVGEGNGKLYHFEQDSINAVTFEELNSNFAGLDVGFYSSPEFTDLDGDSLLDLIIGDSGGRIWYYEQDSINSENFSQISNNIASELDLTWAIPRFFDVNNDGRTDMLIGDDAGGISLFLRNDDMDITPPDIPQNLAASVSGDYVDLSWTACEAEDLLLYNIYRSTRNDTTVAEYLTSVDYDVTIFIDSSLTETGTYYYWLTALDLIGNESAFSDVDSANITIVGIKDIQESIVDDFTLYQNYPNPFNPETTIRYTVRAQNLVPQRVELSIYNTLGQRVATLVNTKQPTG
ncbi:MAG: FG-GAP-like repeat-containing protein, partial [Calditrichaceae bacterium]